MIIETIWKFSLIWLACVMFGLLYYIIGTVVEHIKENRTIKRNLLIQDLDRSHCTERYFEHYFRNEL